jgi:hypothetical protein
VGGDRVVPSPCVNIPTMRKRPRSVLQAFFYRRLIMLHNNSQVQNDLLNRRRLFQAARNVQIKSENLQ